MVVVFDNGGEFLVAEFQELLQSYGIKAVPTIVQNPQSNGCIERMHLTAADMLRTIDLEVEDDCPIKISDAINTMFQTVACGLRTTVSTVTETSPGGTVFNRDMIFNFKMRTDWEKIVRKRDRMAENGNVRENSKCKPYEYRVGEKVLIVRKRYERTGKICDAPTEGPFKVVSTSAGIGVVEIQRGRYTERVNIRRLKPYKEQDTDLNNET